MGLFSSIGNALSSFTSAAGGVLGDVGTTALDLIPGIGDARSQTAANRINQQEADINRRFQERMSNTAYQRAMEDMRKAGLNPTLAYMQGGASQPSGSQATVQSAPKTALADQVMKHYTGISTAQSQKQAVEQQSQLNDSTIKLNSANAVKSAAEAERIREDTKGMGRKAEEGNLWKRFYKGVNNLLDASSKDVQKRSNEPLIKNLGPADKKEASGMFKWLQGGKTPK